MSNIHLTPKHPFPATLIVGPDSTKEISSLLAKLGHSGLQNNPDIFFIDDGTGYSIESIRQIRSFFSQKPFSHSSRVCLIPNCHNLEIPAQNALLKQLEEPGNNNFLILATSRPHQLLSTILSRCHQVILPPTTGKKAPVAIPSSIAQRLALADKVGLDKTAIKSWLEEQLATLQSDLITTTDKRNVANIKVLMKSLDMIKHHLDPRAALDFYFLSFQSNNQ